MDRYYVNDHEQANGDHEVHKAGCYWLSLAWSKTDLGMHLSCVSAVAAAKRIYLQSNGCVFCATACHTS
jgi:hypothetical protein